METNKNMQENKEFQEFGKGTHYKAPEGFFETVSEKTLLKAKQREKNHRKSLIVLRSLAVAASIAAVFFIGYFISGPAVKQESNLIVLDNQSVEQYVIQKQGIARQPEVVKMTKAVPKKAPEKIIAEGNNIEEIGDVLADLSDEELAQLAAMFETDPFISESAQ